MIDIFAPKVNPCRNAETFCWAKAAYSEGHWVEATYKEDPSEEGDVAKADGEKAESRNRMHKIRAMRFFIRTSPFNHEVENRCC